MKAVVFDQFGEPADVLRVREVDVPVPRHGQVLVRMQASPVNPSDLMTVRGIYGKLPRLPATPGFEGVGVVESAGGGMLGRMLRGRRVAVLNGISGNWSEQTVVPAKQAIPLPVDLSREQAAMFFVNPATACILSRQVLRPRRGEWLLQTAAASSLGKMVVRLGKHYGFRTINVVRREQQAEELRSLGGRCIVFDATRDEPRQLADAVAQIVEGNGVRYAIDAVGGATAAAVVKCLGLGGRLVVYGTLSPEPLSISSRELMTPAALIEGFWLARWMQRLRLWGKMKLVRKITRLMRAGVLISDVARSFSLDDIGDAVTVAEQPARGGKVLLTM